MQDPLVINTIFYVIILIFSVVVHEVSHGIMADKLGDPTARMEGRITLNPIPHLDPIGSIILPIVLVISHSPFLVGWAKPVPFNPYNFRRSPFIQKYGEAMVAIAGPISNILIALIAGLALRFLSTGNLVGAATLSILSTIVLVNAVLAVFNLIPVPPLDGSKIIFAFIPYKLRSIRAFMESNGVILSLIVIIFLWRYIAPLAFLLYKVIVGA